MRASATAILALTASFGNAKDKEHISHRTSQKNQHENIKEQLLSFLSKEKSNHHPPKQGNTKNSLRNSIENLSVVGTTEKHDFKEDDASNFSTNIISDDYKKNTPSSDPPVKQRFLKFSSDGVLVNNDKNKVDDPKAQGPHKNVISNNDTIEGDQSEADVGILRLSTDSSTGASSVPRLLGDEAAACGDISCNGVAFDTPCSDQGESVTVSSGSCNGNRACYYIKSPATISCSSCNIGYAACAFMGQDANLEFTIKNHSCNAEGACAGFGQGAADTHFVIDGHSCNSESACFRLGARAKNGSFLSIHDGSCDDIRACKLLGYKSNGGSITINDYSCIGYKVCYKAVGNIAAGTNVDAKATISGRSCIGYESCSCVGYSLYDGKLTIDGDSCIGEGSCRKFGYQASGESSITNDSCNGKKACENVGFKSENSRFMIRGGSCKGDYSCYAMNFLGVNGAPGKLTIDGDSCIGENSCRKFLYRGSGESSITNGSCHGKKACENVGKESWDSIFTILGGSCKGDYSCYAMGFYGSSGADRAYIHIDSDACNGYGACFQLGKYSKSEKISIGEGSCNGKFACATAWIKDHGFEIIIGKNACTCDHCCAFLLPGSRIGNGECTSLSDGCSGQAAPVIKGSL